MEERAKKVTEAFDELSKDYDKFMDDTGHGQARDKVCLLLLPQIEGKVLDVGVGTGALAKLIHENKNLEVVGVDPSKKMIEIAREKHQGIRFMVAPVESLPFEENCFDTVVCCLALEWVAHKQIALKEMDRVSKGRIILMEEKGVVKALQQKHEETLAPVFKKLSSLEEMADPEFYKSEMSKLSYSLKKEVEADIDGKHSLLGMVFVK